LKIGPLQAELLTPNLASPNLTGIFD
jgi:hypothetical protein